MNADRLLAHYEKVADAPDAIPRLRHFILDLAVRGKLVEQDPKDGNGSSLLVKVERAWAERISSGKVKKQKVWESPGFSDVPFEVPNNWALVRLGQAVELVNGRAFKPSDWTPTGLPIVRIQNLNNPTASFNRYDGEVKDKFLIDTGDFLISWSGTPGTSFGAHVWERGPAVLNQHIFKSIIIGDAFEIPFLKLAINSRLLELIEQAHGGVGLQHITKPKLEAVALTLPPRAEQHRIVAKVDELMALCDRLEAARTEREATRDRLATASLARLNAPDPDPAVFQNCAAFAFDNLIPLTTRRDQIKALRQTILNLAVRGKLVEQDPEDESAAILLAGGKRCKPQESRHADTLGWLVFPVGALLEFRYGKGKKASERINEGPVPVFGSNGIVGYCEAPLTEAPSIIVGRKGSAGALNLCNGPSWTTDVAYFVEAPNFFDLRYLLIGLQALHLESLGKGVKPGLSCSDVYDLPLSVPPLAEQHRIVAKVDELMALCDRLEASLTKGDDTRRGLLDALLHEGAVTEDQSAVCQQISGNAVNR